MSESRDQSDLLIRYLLGVASATERDEVEEQLFADDKNVDVLLRAEDELIDDYVRGVLSDSDRLSFENHFLCTKERQQRLETVQSFVSVLSQMELAGRSVSSERPQGSFGHADRPARNRTALAEKQLTAEGFQRLLNWLDSDKEKAAEKFVNLQRRLIHLFTARGFVDAEALADETINRVASKLSQILETYVGDPAIYFYRVARGMMLEATRQSAHAMPEASAVVRESGTGSKQRDICLEKCLEQLSEKNRELILQFYAFDKKDKIATRKKLAQSLGISEGALRIRVYKLRQALEKCVKSCLERE